MPFRICIHLAVHCLYCPAKYNFLISSMVYFQSSEVCGNISLEFGVVVTEDIDNVVVEEVKGTELPSIGCNLR